MTNLLKFKARLNITHSKASMCLCILFKKIYLREDEDSSGFQQGKGN